MKVAKYETPRHPNTDGWCREGIAMETRPGVWSDTFWSTGSETHILTDAQVETLEVLFDTDDYEEVPHTPNREALWMQYRPEDRKRITHQAGRTLSLWVKKGSKPDLSTRIANKRREVQEAEEELRSAGHRLSWLGEELGRLYEQQSSTASA